MLFTCTFKLIYITLNPSLVISILRYDNHAKVMHLLTINYAILPSAKWNVLMQESQYLPFAPYI